MLECSLFTVTTCEVYSRSWASIVEDGYYLRESRSTALIKMTTPLIFVTGATGFIGSQVVATTLRAGYRVRLSIRRAEQEATLRELHPGYGDKIETCIIPDISQRESFKDAFQGVDYVFHLASPIPGGGNDFKQDYVEPAVRGTEAILYAALEFAQIKKVIVMSSVLALAPVTALLTKDISIKGEYHKR